MPGTSVNFKITEKFSLNILQLDQTQKLVQQLSSQLSDLRDQMTEQRKHKQRMGKNTQQTSNKIFLTDQKYFRSPQLCSKSHKPRRQTLTIEIVKYI